MIIKKHLESDIIHFADEYCKYKNGNKKEVEYLKQLLTNISSQLEPLVMQKQADRYISLYEKYYRAAENLIGYLIKNRKHIPDKYFVPYEAEHVELNWALADKEKASQFSA